MARMAQPVRSIRNRPEIPVISQPRDLEAKLRGSCRSSTRDLKSRDDMNQIHKHSGQRPLRPRTTSTQILPMIEVGCNTVDRLPSVTITCGSAKAPHCPLEMLDRYAGPNCRRTRVIPGQIRHGSDGTEAILSPHCASLYVASVH